MMAAFSQPSLWSELKKLRHLKKLNYTWKCDFSVLVEQTAFQQFLDCCPKINSLDLLDMRFGSTEDLQSTNLAIFSKMISDYADNHPKRVIKLKLALKNLSRQRLPPLLLVPPNVHLSFPNS
jgi:hypothetical protein